jgi:hypothetical protein
VCAVQDGTVTLNGLSKQGLWADFSENLGVSLFNDDLSNHFISAGSSFWTVPLRRLKKLVINGLGSISFK